MAEDRKSILLRIPPDLWEQINRLAQSELRSVNAQMEFLLREALKRRGIGEKLSDNPSRSEANDR